MKKLITCLAICLLLYGRAAAAPLTVNGTELDETTNGVYCNTTYVSLRAVTEALRDDADVFWADGQACVQTQDLTLTARPGDLYIKVNDRVLYVPNGVRLEAGVTAVPVRTLAQALGATVDWDSATGAVTVNSSDAALEPGETFYQPDDLYWLARIISAESKGEPFLGQLAVGGVILNRRASQEFPDSIYDVIFDSRWGGQFEPVRNGAIYDEPAAESVIAAKLCLEGADVSGGSIYFLAPALTDNHWTIENRQFIMTIGSHWFYR